MWKLWLCPWERRCLMIGHFPTQHASPWPRWCNVRRTVLWNSDRTPHPGNDPASQKWGWGCGFSWLSGWWLDLGCRMDTFCFAFQAHLMLHGSPWSNQWQCYPDGRGLVIYLFQAQNVWFLFWCAQLRESMLNSECEIPLRFCNMLQPVLMKSVISQDDPHLNPFQSMINQYIIWPFLTILGTDWILGAAAISFGSQMGTDWSIEPGPSQTKGRAFAAHVVGGLLAREIWALQKVGKSLEAELFFGWPWWFFWGQNLIGWVCCWGYLARNELVAERCPDCEASSKMKSALRHRTIFGRTVGQTGIISSHTWRSPERKGVKEFR